jgi:hypothetical protein
MDAYEPHFLGVIHLQHSPKIFAASILLFSVIYWFLGPDHFFDNVDPTGTDIRHVKMKVKGNTYFDYLYFAVVVQSLLGFGDIVPATRIARLCVCIQILTSMYLLLSTGSAILMKKKK